MERAYPQTILLARSREYENWAVEVGTLYFEYRLLLPDELLLGGWRRHFPHDWRAFGGDDPCALERRRVDRLPSQSIEGTWAIIFFAPTVWGVLWNCGELQNEETQGCHSLFTFACTSRRCVREIGQQLAFLTEQRLRDAFDERFQTATRRLRRKDRIARIRTELLAEYEQANQARIAQVQMLQEERECLVTGVGAPLLLPKEGHQNESEEPL